MLVFKLSTNKEWLIDVDIPIANLKHIIVHRNYAGVNNVFTYLNTLVSFVSPDNVLIIIATLLMFTFCVITVMSNNCHVYFFPPDLPPPFPVHRLVEEADHKQVQETLDPHPPQPNSKMEKKLSLKSKWSVLC